MHSPEIRQKFIELRADAQSIPHIASLLGVAQSTLRLWEKNDALEIARLRCSYWEDAEDKVGITLEHRLRRMAEWIKGAEDELEKRHFDLMNNRDLMRFLREARREYFRLRAMLFNAPGKIGELADFPKTQPRNINHLQQPKSSPTDFLEGLVADDVRAKPRCETESNSSQVTSPGAPANSKPPSAYAAHDSQLTPTAQPIQPPIRVPHLCGPKLASPNQASELHRAVLIATQNPHYSPCEQPENA